MKTIAVTRIMARIHSVVKEFLSVVSTLQRLRLQDVVELLRQQLRRRRHLATISSLSEELDDILQVQSLFRGVKRNALLLAQHEQTRCDLPAFVNLFKARSVGSNMFVDKGMTRLMVMAMEDRCGRFVALAITANFYGGRQPYIISGQWR
jgi:hypothetical protein